MTIALHVPTLLLTVIVTHGICSCAVAFLRWKHPSIPGLGHFLLGTLTTIPAMVIYLVDTGEANIFSLVVANLISVTSVALSLDGISKFYGRPFRRPCWPFTLLLAPLLVYWSLIDPQTEPRVTTVILPMAVICLLIAWFAFTQSAEDERIFSSLISFGFGAFGLAFLARLASMTWNPLARILDAGAPSTAMTFLLSSVAVICSTLGLALVANQRWARELIDAREAAEAGSRAKSQFLAVMSHEIRTPMNGVLGAAALILDSPTTPKIRRYARTVQHSGRAMLKIVDEVLDYSKIEAGGLDLEKIPFDLQIEVEATVGAFRDAAEVAGLKLSLEFSDGLKATLAEQFVNGDPARLRQILSNLINNALKFTDQGGISIFVCRHEELDDGRCVIEFEVRDTGPGVPYDIQPDLFQPFKQADTSTTRRFGGTGLGLAICRDLVERMGGRIGYRTPAPDPGSIFWFRIPFPLTEATGTQEPSSELHPGAVIRLSGARILVAEDNSINQFVISEMLEDLGHQVIMVVDGQAAVEAVRMAPFDLVLMDCRMPTLDGFEAARQIRRDPQFRELPIIAVTATAFEQDHQQCFEAGMNAVLTKPIESKELFRALETWLPSPDAPKTKHATRKESVAEGLSS